VLPWKHFAEPQELGRAGNSFGISMWQWLHVLPCQYLPNLVDELRLPVVNRYRFSAKYNPIAKVKDNPPFIYPRAAPANL
jgi:hypothetical protein